MNIFRDKRFRWPLAAVSVLVLFALGVSYAYFIEPHRLVVRHEQIAIKTWDRAFDGLRIAMIGDIHGGSNGADRAKLRSIVERVNADNVDLVVLLGDYVSQIKQRGPRNEWQIAMQPAEIADGISGMQAKFGVIAVLGNHDGWYGDKQVEQELTRVGIRVLQNELFTIERDGKKLRILGLKDHMKVGSWKAYSDDAKNVVASTEGTGDLVVLEHSPDILPLVTGDLAISKDLKLFLAAHTHGGQVWFPILGRPIIPSSYGQKYAYGHVVDRGVDMWVTSGIGESLLPLRFMVPPEVVILTVNTAIEASH